jgi:cytochrome c oxidase subunit 2
LVLGVAALAVVAVACAPNNHQDSLNPQGPYAQKITSLFTPVFWIAAAIFFIVEGLLVLFAIRYRHRRGRQAVPPQVHGNNRLEIAWTILPALILVGVAVPTVSTIYDLARKPTGTVLNVNVIGHQWWWEFDYPDEKIVTANEMHIPVGEPVYVSLCAAGQGYAGQVAPNACQPGPPKGAPPAAVGDDVIHSFWVPELAGKQDVVPGRTNNLILEADEPGTYTGQCAEFCGLSHAYMRFKVIAQTAADFDAWVRAQQADAVTPSEGSLAATGLSDFLNGQCIACHAIQGPKVNGQPLSANGGPNLTHLMSRDCFAGCTFDLTEANLEKWLADPPAMKPGSWMPNYHLSQDQIKALVAYLMTLN